ncbi:ribonucleases P/MRP protein subunit POP1-domain-containing protein [Dactylonectria estremocensis]|uniref:Ribonucleases P/MRP protein subunit POP1-domain-containing protein n=1 Tax=Dactylonectria estremocensis TaxID=1079267 RepID=A0A9P9FCW3_9HYPO|nr:ribonucleases P/MRP protein subunit POP1-domain-containing protein [Dactylonectria estremocensis]
MAPGSASAGSGQRAKRNPGPSSTTNTRADAANSQKRPKLVHIARAIPAQPADSALKDGELDLQAFLAAHEFEIRSLEQSMATSKAVSSSRAFQKVPRGLRRRTASHNPKRVPRRLRARARKEVEGDQTPIVDPRKKKQNPRTTRGRIRVETARRLGVLAARKRRKAMEAKAQGMDIDGKDHKALAILGRRPRPKIRRNQLNEPPTPKARFRKRQINKTWLPTHPWHAKRSRMTAPLEPLWRFSIPLTPNEKLYRPTHRAQGDRGTLVWDMSYMSTIGLYGNAAGIETVLKNIGLSQDSCWNTKGRTWRMGTRSWTGLVSRQMGKERRLIGPCTIQWNPESSPRNAADPQKEQRQVFFRIHPSAFLELFNELLRLSKMQSPQLYIEDLRFEIGSLELTGPASTETLLAVLNPYLEKSKQKSRHTELFQSLAGLTNPASLPAGAVLGFSIQDPRLHYPPRKVTTSDSPEAQLELLEKIAAWTAEDNLEPFPIFSRDARHAASCLRSQTSINRRRAEKAKSTPGVPLKPTSTDHPIPIALIASRAGSGTQSQGTWTLLAPWKCILPIWYSIVHVPLSTGGNPRFAGLDQARQVAFERGLPWFPGDFLGTDAGAKWELDERRKRQRAWDRRPKSKRIEWKSLDLGASRKGEVGNGTASDFEFLFELVNSRPEPGAESTEGDINAMDIDQGETQELPSLNQLSHVSKTLFNEILASPNPPSPSPPNAILTVRITVLGRGVVTSSARIYRLPSSLAAGPASSEAEVLATIPTEPSQAASSLPHDLRAQWLTRIAPTTKGKTSGTPKARDLESLKRQLALQLIAQPSPYPRLPANHSDIGGHPLVPDADDLIGFVTTGAFCLSEGRGVAMGSIALEKVLANVTKDPKEGRLCIVRNAGENVGWIARWDVV